MCVVAGYGKRVSDPLKTSATRPPTIFGIFEKILLLFRLEGMGHLEISCKHAVGTSAVLRQKDAGLFREVAEAAAHFIFGDHMKECDINHLIADV